MLYLVNVTEGREHVNAMQVNNLPIDTTTLYIMYIHTYMTDFLHGALVLCKCASGGEKDKVMVFRSH